MSEATKHIQHTPGPLSIHVAATLIDKPCLIDAEGGKGIAVTESHGMSIEEQHANALLLTAAFNSYDKHFGPRAVEAAEADVLGKALEALRMLRDAGAVPSLSSLPNTDTEIGRAAKAAHEALAAAKEVTR